MIVDRKEVMYCTPQSVGTEVLKIDYAPKAVKDLIASGKPIVYTTGGWQGTMAQWTVMNALEGLPVVMGLEPDEFLLAKGYEFPITPLEERLKFYRHVAPNNSVIFEIPADTDYEELAKYLGVFQNPYCYHLASKSDNRTVFNARRARAYDDRRFLPITIGTAHTVDYYKGG